MHYQILHLSRLAKFFSWTCNTHSNGYHRRKVILRTYFAFNELNNILSHGVDLNTRNVFLDVLPIHNLYVHILFLKHFILEETKSSQLHIYICHNAPSTNSHFIICFLNFK